MPPPAVRTIALPFGERIPVLGQGTWHMAEDSARLDEELEALRLGLDLGLTLVDTAAMYADGAAASLTGRELDVLHLVARGKTNAEIGRASCRERV